MMDENFFREMITYKIKNDEMSPFGWYFDVFVFQIHSISKISENNELGNKDDYIISCSSENMYEGKKINDKRFKKDIIFTNDEINKYISNIRDQKIKELGI